MWKVLRRSRSLFRVARSISSAPQRPTRLPARPSRQPIADHPSQVTRAIQVLTLLHLTRTMATAPTVQLSPEEWKAKVGVEGRGGSGRQRWAMVEDAVAVCPSHVRTSACTLQCTSCLTRSRTPYASVAKWNDDLILFLASSCS
eukprot:m.164827 g.164827  ORF g.164827 m.164827 type:complete len:144 (-) comp14410_c0_seq4:2412-2843(-)